MWDRARPLRRDGWVDGGFASAFLLLLVELWWPTLLGPRGVPAPIPLVAILIVAFAAVGDARFWPRLRLVVLWASLFAGIGGVTLHAERARLEHVTQPAFVALCLLLAAWARLERRRARAG